MIKLSQTEKAPRLSKELVCVAKSLLSTEEIKTLQESGTTIAEIARRADITKPSVRHRLDPEYHQKRHAETYEANSDKLNQNAKAWAAEQQRISKETATRSGSWTDEELDYLRDHGATSTVLEIAVKLERTFRSVRSTAQRYSIPLRK